nr:hypothetical protein [Candidatus Sigynarchaeota archaeon]
VLELDGSGNLYLAGWLVDQTIYEDFNLIAKYALNPEYFVLSSNAESPDTDGIFDLSWGVNPLAKNFSIYYSLSPIKAINGSQIIIASGLVNNSYHTNFLADDTYYIVVQAVNEYGAFLSNCISVTVSLSPPGPFTLSTNAANPDLDGNFNLSWTSAKEAKNYSIFTASSNITEFNASVVLVAFGLTNLSYGIQSKPNGNHYFIVVAYNDHGNTTSKCLLVQVALGPPGVFTVTSNAGFPDGDGQFTLSWTIAEGADNYSVYFSTSSISTLNGDEIEIANGITGNSHLVVSSPTGIIYYAVVAHNEYGWRLSSNYLMVYVTGQNPVLPGFFNVTTTADDPDPDGTFMVNWGTAANAVNYSLYTSSSFIYSIGSASLIMSGNTNRSIQMTSLPAGNYYFKVVAFHSNGNNRTSKCIRVTVIGGPPTPSTLSSNAFSPDYDGCFNLTWTASLRAQNYSIYRHSS